MKTTLGDAATLALCLLVCMAIAALGSLTTVTEVPTWYAMLAKPAWTPPDWAFPVAWTVLYVLIAVSLWLLLSRTPSSGRRWAAVWLFVVQLALNAMWSPVFFGLHQPVPGLVVIVLLDVAVLATIVTAWPVNRAAASLLLPYLAWIAYATTLNAGIVVLNR